MNKPESPRATFRLETVQPEAGGRGTALDDNSTMARDVLGKGDVGACTRA